MHAAPQQFRFFHGGGQFAVFQNGGGRIAQYAADSQDDHRPPFSRFSIFAQVSRSATVRLKTSLPGAVSGSTEK